MSLYGKIVRFSLDLTRGAPVSWTLFWASDILAASGVGTVRWKAVSQRVHVASGRRVPAFLPPPCYRRSGSTRKQPLRAGKTVTANPNGFTFESGVVSRQPGDGV
jgi:hypothetical protein